MKARWSFSVRPGEVLTHLEERAAEFESLFEVFGGAEVGTNYYEAVAHAYGNVLVVELDSRLSYIVKASSLVRHFTGGKNEASVLLASGHAFRVKGRNPEEMRLLLHHS